MRFTPIPQDRLSMYTDHAYKHTRVPGYRFFAAYTPYWIQRQDGYFCQRIVTAQTKNELLQVARDISNFPHFHPAITENLLWNLRMKLRHLTWAFDDPEPEPDLSDITPF